MAESHTYGTKEYGDTSIGNNARAHLGDISQDVHIRGDVHIHMQAPQPDSLASLTIFATAVHALEVSEKLLVLSNKVLRGKAIWKEMVDFRLFSQRVQLLKTQSPSIPEFPHLPRSDKNPQQTMRTLISSAIQLAQDSLDLTRVVLLPAVEQRISSSDSIGFALSDEEEYTKTQARNQVDLQKFKHYLENLSSMTDTIPLSRVRKVIDAYRDRLISLRASINPNLSSLLNHVDARATSHAPYTLDLEGNVSPVQSNDDIVEVLSFNRSIVSGPHAVAAIMTRRNGDLSAVSNHDFVTSATEDLRGNSVIRYDLKTFDTEDQEFPYTESAPNFSEQIKSALYFKEESDRYFEVKAAHAKTFRWIFGSEVDSPSPQFPKWLSSPGGCFWINGKAGSGKSTLMKYIHKQNHLSSCLHQWAHGRRLLTATFFFWQAGTSLQRSHEGIMRSILYQVVEERPDLIPVIFPRLSRHLLRTRSEDSLIIPLTELQEALLLLVNNIPEDLALFLMVDGIDEYSGDHLNFAKFLVRMAQRPWVKLLLSSRPIPECFHVFSECPSLRLQDLTKNDISDYVEHELMSDKLVVQMDAIEKEFSTKLKQILVEKSSGVFLWVVLVVHKVLMGLIHYEDKASLLAKIDELPIDLEDLYDHMFSQMNKAYRYEGSTLLQLLSRAQEAQEPPLTALQFSVAASHLQDIHAGHSIRPPDLRDEAMRLEILAGKLRSRCCGLVEIQEQGARGPLLEPKAAFLHRTVYDYLQNPAVWTKLTKIRNITQTERDKSLIASCTHLLEHRLSQPPYRVMGSSDDYFIACVQYSSIFSCANDNFYVDYLRRSEHCFRQLSKSGGLSHNFEYNTAWSSAVHRLISNDQLDSISTSTQNDDLDSQWTMMKLAASLGLFAFLKEVVNSPASSDHASPNKSIFLLKMIDELKSTRQNSALARNIVSTVSFLLNTGIDPILPYDRYPMENPSDLLQAPGSRSDSMSPWTYWLQQFEFLTGSFGLEHILITRLFLKAAGKRICVDKSALGGFQQLLADLAEAAKGEREDGDAARLLKQLSHIKPVSNVSEPSNTGADICLTKWNSDSSTASLRANNSRSSIAAFRNLSQRGLQPSLAVTQVYQAIPTFSSPRFQRDQLREMKRRVYSEVG